MRRSILIVICDFLILSALSLSGGFEDGRVMKSVAAIDRGAALAPMAAAMPSITDAEIELFLERHKARSLAGDVERLEAALSRSEGRVQALADDKDTLERRAGELVATLEQRATAIKQLEGTTTDLRRQSAELDTKLKEREQEVAALDTRAGELEKEKSALGEDLRRREENIAQLTERTEKLDGEKRDLQTLVAAQTAKSAELDEQAKRLDDERRRLMEELAKRGQDMAALESKVGDLATEKSKLEAARERQEAIIDDLRASSRVLVEGFTTLRDVIRSRENDIESLRTHYQELDVGGKAIRDELSEVIRYKQEEIETLSKRIAGDGFIWDKYRNSARELVVRMRGREPFIDKTYNDKLLLPEIILNDHRFLVGEFDTVGLGWPRVVDGNMIEVSFKVMTRGDEPKIAQLSKPVVVFTPEPRICLFPVPDEIESAPLEPVGFEELSKRGLEGIYLFKPDGRSREASCSFARDGGPYLDIHDGAGVAKDVAARKGDFLFTREGGFVGVLVADGLARVFPRQIVRGEAEVIPLTKPQDQRYFQDFTDKIKQISDRIR